MKVNKITFVVCLPIIIISGILLFTYPNNTMFQSILSGIFTGFLVSLVAVIIGYFHERAKIFEAIDLNLRSLYVNMTVISKILGNILPEIHHATAISDFSFKNISGLSVLNLEFIRKMNLGLYSPIFGKSEKSLACKRLKEFYQIAYSIRNCSEELEKMVLKYGILYLDIQNDQMKGIQVPLDKLGELDERKNLINIKTAKLHEYVTGQSMEVGKIAKNFYGYKKKRLYWDDLETKLLAEVKNIVRGM